MQSEWQSAVGKGPKARRRQLPGAGLENSVETESSQKRDRTATESQVRPDNNGVKAAGPLEAANK